MFSPRPAGEGPGVRAFSYEVNPFMPPVTLLYTAALEGRLALLPVLFTRIQQERAAVAGMAGITLLADLGRSCAPGDWLCDATDGRGMLVAMDAIGYDAFHIGAQDMLYTRPAAVQQLREAIQTGVAAGPWCATFQRSELRVAIAANLSAVRERADLTLILRLSHAPVASATWDGSRRVVVLDGGWTATTPLLGRLDMALTPAPPYIEIVKQTQLDIPPDLLPDPTIMGVIEFVESEARYAQRKRGSGDRSG
jgi:hypothetical protein